MRLIMPCIEGMRLFRQAQRGKLLLKSIAESPGVAELADAHDSKSCGRKAVSVRPRPSGPTSRYPVRNSRLQNPMAKCLFRPNAAFESRVLVPADAAGVIGFLVSSDRCDNYEAAGDV